MLDALPRRLEAYGQLSQPETQALLRLPARLKSLAAGEDYLREGARSSACAFVVSGLVCSYKLLPDGRRQILALHVPGDACDLHGRLLPMDHAVGAMTAGSVALVSHVALEEISQGFPRIAQALWQLALAEAAVLRERLVSMGRKSAHSRVAHFCCEMVVRLQAAGQADGLECDLPLTQADLADVAGLSVVHVNRVLQGLRNEGLISFDGRTLVALDWEGLTSAAEFDPAYLHLGKRTPPEAGNGPLKMSARADRAPPALLP